MSNLSVSVKVTSKNKLINIANELILIKSESSTTCWDIITSLSQKSQLLQHILTYIQHYNINNNDDDDDDDDKIDSDYIEIIAFKESEESITYNIPKNKPIHPLLNRHSWKTISFLIKDDLMIQSKIFLSHINSNNDGDIDTIASVEDVDDIDDDMEIDNIDGKEREFKYKRFVNRHSPITSFTALSEISSLYHIFGAILLVFLTGILTNEALEKGVLYRFDLLRWNFGHSDKVFLIWCAMFSYSFIFVMLFNQYKQRAVDRLNFGVFYFFLLLPLLYIPFHLIRYLKLPVASSAIIACEQMRFIMKIHAYIFEMFRACHYGQAFHNLPNMNDLHLNRNLNEYLYLEKDWINAWQQCMKMTQIRHYPPSISIKSISNSSGLSTPTKSYQSSPEQQQKINVNPSIPIVVQIAHYPYHQHIHSFLNFVFCPSLVYRWSYPTLTNRKNGNVINNEDNIDYDYYKINWSNVFYQIINMMGCLLFVFVVFYHNICPTFENTPYEAFTLSTFLSSVFSAAIPGMLLVIMCFFGVVHCWLNMWSEITGYCDRIFYEDWWNANTFASYSKKWNLVVYNWSYNYFFLPMLEAGYSKQSADLLTFILWAAVQEYVFTAVSRCFYPVLLISCCIFGILFYSLPFADSSLKFYNNTMTSIHTIKSNENEINNGGVWNVFLWIMLFLQNGFFVSLYAREWYTTRAFEDGKIILDQQSLLPYSWQTKYYPNRTRIDI